MFAFLAGLVVGGLGILTWNHLNPNKVAKFTAKYKTKIEEELAKLNKK